jgi:hypothetical protein
VISVGLAKELAVAGLAWVPAQGDRFVIDRAGLRDQTWVLSDMVVELHDHRAGQILGFNGTTEWALDSVDVVQALWLPSEEQLRTRLGPTFRALERLEGIRPETATAGNGEAGFRVRLVVDDKPLTFEAPDPATAYGRALLHTLLIGAMAG